MVGGPIREGQYGIEQPVIEKHCLISKDSPIIYAGRRRYDSIILLLLHGYDTLK
jgi:hypothetical protein